MAVDSLAVEKAIEAAELQTSGEIRVHIETTCKGDVMDRASVVFAALKMHKTEARNGVLVYLSTEDRKFAILGDMGINAKVDDKFWQETYDLALPLLKGGDWTEALCGTVESCGEQLKDYFPYVKGDADELDNSVSWGD
ncbi:MAG: TPM domain-containing protein [Bacteroidota bacterium]|nr:TPM domain-containing protein [Bacteroidota bacterium]